MSALGFLGHGPFGLGQNGDGAPAPNGGMAPGNGMAPMPPGNGMGPGPMPPGNGMPPAPHPPVKVITRTVGFPRYLTPAAYFYPYPYGYGYPRVFQAPASRFICRRLEEESEEAGEDVFECEAPEAPRITYPVAYGPFGWF